MIRVNVASGGMKMMRCTCTVIFAVFCSVIYHGFEKVMP